MTATVYPASILTTSEKNAYVPINGEASNEEINLQSIGVEGLALEDKQTTKDVTSAQLVAKIAMLIGLCK